jgi:hypothetical protein
VIRRLIAAYTSPVLRKVYQFIYLRMMFLSCLIRTFIHPAAQMRLIDRFTEPAVRYVDVAASWLIIKIITFSQPFYQLITAGLKRLTSLF